MPYSVHSVYMPYSVHSVYMPYSVHSVYMPYSVHSVYMPYSVHSVYMPYSVHSVYMPYSVHSVMYSMYCVDMHVQYVLCGYACTVCTVWMPSSPRDLKSKNVLLTGRIPCQAKLCDFGLSRMRQESATMTGGRGQRHRVKV